MSSHRLPDGSIPVPLSSDTADGLRAEAAAVLGYLEAHPAVTPERVSDMLFRTRTPRRHRALATVTTRDELVGGLRAVAAGDSHPAVVVGDGPATARRVGFVFPGQGSQRPGMGKLYYELSTAYRDTVDACSAIHAERFGHTQPLHYLRGDEDQYEDTVWEVQPALMFHMTGLAAMWQAAGVRPAATIGHSQGELAAGAVSGVMSLHDAVLVVTHRANLVQRISPRGYSMAVLAMNREDCEMLLARHSGWAELSVVNAPHIMAISGDRQTIKDMVEMATARGRFAREIGVSYPAHTSIVAEVRADFEGFLGGEMDTETFTDTEIPSYGATLGAAITPDLTQEQYWYWNLRNRVRFDRAIVSAATDGIDTLIEVVEHPVLQLAIQENLTLVPRDPARGNRDFKVLGTSLRTADSLRDFTRNLATVAVHDLGYDWSALRTGSAPSLPLRDFPHTIQNNKKLWAPAGYAPAAITAPLPPVPAPQRLIEAWVPWERRAMTPPRTLAFIDPTGRSTDLVAALIKAADRHGANALLLDAVAGGDSATVSAAQSDSASGGSAHGANAPGAVANSGAVVQGGVLAVPVSGANGASAPGDLGAVALTAASGLDAAGSGFDTAVIVWPALPEADGEGTIDELVEFFAAKQWLPALTGLRPGGECWLVTVGGESVVPGDAVPQLFHSAVAAGFRSIGIERPGLALRHLDLPAGAGAEQAVRIIGALHTAGEPEVALRDGKVFVKRLHADESEPGAAADLDHVLIIGGTGQLGLLFCDHFARSGAGRVTLLSRSGESAATAAELARLRGLGATEIAVVACDATDPEAVGQFAAAQVGRPVSMIIHAAVNYVDAELADITEDMVRTAAASKVVGLETILSAVPRTANARVLLCSSMAATLGGRGQILYAVTNRMLDTVARRLRAEGLDCTSLEWGLWSVAGPLDDAGMARVEGAGVYPMRPEAAIAAGFTGQPTDAVIISADWPFLRDILGTFGLDAVLREVPEPVLPVAVVETPTPAPEPEPAAVAPQPVAAPAPLAAPDVSLPDQLLIELGRVMGVDGTDALDRSTPLVALGLDSLQALDFRKRVRSALDRDLPVAAILGGATFDDVVLLMAENTN
ncbi:SDR family NAD(P)-dependent oxidoreductase [Nocardia yamanashiensis]|uniref:SDR family NAD(P)-dependent oxidoreductase n=1 Tax=Nocardia yamanashiensis TaxID=209247 RepID=UPI001E5E6866|nr:SDR family NAD(P)-dependent oxidoreductase [Nocardia yamanashiensis]UGT39739.1 SDR family NAD(P)-dependent oxidoreductase [Nocardia yamanashiensis]